MFQDYSVFINPIFQDYYWFPLIQYFKTFFLSYTKKKKKTLCIFIHPFHPVHFFFFIYTCLQLFMTSHLKYTQTKNDVIYLQPFNYIYITPTLLYHFILTSMSRLWPKNGTCIFYLVMKAYKFDIDVRCCGFCKSFDWLWVFGCVGFWCGKVLNICCFKNKEK